MKRFYVNLDSPVTIDSLIGKTAIVLEPASSDLTHCVLVKLEGEIWHAHPLNGKPLEKGQLVIVHAVNGLFLTVAPQ